MTFDSEWRYDSGRCDHSPRARTARAQRMFGGSTLAGVALACAWIVYVNLGSGVDQTEVVGTRGDKLVTTTPRSRSPAHDFAALFDPHSLGFPPGTFVKRMFASRTPAHPNEPAGPQPRATTPVQQAQSAPAAPQSPPQSRPPQVRAAALREETRSDRIASNGGEDRPSLFERLFGKPTAPTLAYASPDDGISGKNSAAGSYDGKTAVYDISAHTVFMPNGTRLEAHSGLGEYLDDPRFADKKNRGVTPPTVYDLEPREGLFHGVRALRLIPVDETKVFGRSGLLAHSFMLGPNGDSNGCVSFRNYEAFLQAYLSHEVKRLVVVAGRV